MAGIIAALLEKPTLHPSFATCTHPPFRFAVIAAGFDPLDPRASVIFKTPVQTPSLHIMGQADTLVVPGALIRRESRVKCANEGPYQSARWLLRRNS